MNTTTHALWAATLSLMMGGTASADVFSSPTRTSSGVTVEVTSAGTNRYNVAITQDVLGGVVVLLDSTDSDDIINKITVYDNPGLPLDQIILTIRKDQTSVARSSLLGVEQIDIVNPSGVNLDLRHLAIDGSVGSSSTLRTIEASTARLIDVGGNLYANIIANNIASGSSSTDDISMTIDGSVIGGGVYNNSGDIALVDVTGNVQPNGSDYPEFWSSSSMDSVNVGGSFEGRIGSNSEGFSGHPDVGDVLIGGDFTGSSTMTMSNLESLDIGGDFDADITISSATGSSGFYSIGGEMASMASISLPSDGLEGQVIINSDDNADAWDGDVVVGSTTLDASDPSDYLTYYTEVSSELGGGQVGLAPFNFHQRTSAPLAGEGKDCDPHQGEAVTAPYDSGAHKNQVIEDVRIRHYGPVYVDGSGPHFRVEFKSDVLPSSWVDRTGLFEVDTTATATSALGAQRDVVIQKTALNATGFTAAGRWRIRPIAGKIQCGDVDGNPDVGWVSGVVSGDLGSGSGTQYSWYAFRVFLEAPGGGMLLQDENVPSSSDIATWVESPYEVNADGETDSGDLADLSEAYGE